MNSLSTPPKFRFITPGFGNIELKQMPPGAGFCSSSAGFQTPKKPGSPGSEGSSPSSSRTTSPLGPNTSIEFQPQTCQCQRPLQVVMCCSCGFTCRGRIRKTCPVHLNSIYLMDMDSCPSCNSERIREFKAVTKS